MINRNVPSLPDLYGRHPALQLVNRVRVSPFNQTQNVLKLVGIRVLATGIVGQDVTKVRLGLLGVGKGLVPDSLWGRGGGGGGGGGGLGFGSHGCGVLVARFLPRKNREEEDLRTFYQQRSSSPGNQIEMNYAVPTDPCMTRGSSAALSMLSPLATQK